MAQGKSVCRFVHSRSLRSKQVILHVQLGALSFGSRMAVNYKLDPDDVFKQFQQQDPNRLLGVCAPPMSTTPDYVKAGLKYLEKSPDLAKRPIGEVFYEALQAAFPCN